MSLPTRANTSSLLAGLKRPGAVHKPTAFHNPAPTLATNTVVTETSTASPLAIHTETATLAANDVDVNTALVNSSSVNTVATDKPQRKKYTRNRARVLTERDLAILKFLREAIIAKTEHVAIAVSGFKNVGPDGGAPVSASPVTIRKSITKLANWRNRDGSSQPLVAINNTVRGASVVHLTAAGFNKVKTAAELDFERTTGSVVKRPAMPKLQNWEHTLALAFLIADDLRFGRVHITDTDMKQHSSALFTQTGRMTIPASELPKLGFYGSQDPDTLFLQIPYLCFQRGNSGKSHRPDLVVMTNSGVGAIEVELSHKGAKELQDILMGYVQAFNDGRYTKVRYFGKPSVITWVRKHLTELGIVEGHRFYDRFDLRDETVSGHYDPETWFTKLPF